MMDKESKNYLIWYNPLLNECRLHFSKSSKNIISHDVSHCLRMWKNAEILGRESNADMDVLIASVFLHDIGVLYTDKVRHGKSSAEIAEGTLFKIGFPKEKVEKVKEAISMHDFHGPAKRSIEAKILYDCDKLDSFGAIGVFRYLDIFIKRGWGIKKIADYVTKDLDDRFNHLHTERAKNLAKPSYLYTKRYFERLGEEL